MICAGIYDSTLAQVSNLLATQENTFQPAPETFSLVKKGFFAALRIFGLYWPRSGRGVVQMEQIGVEIRVFGVQEILVERA